MREFVVIILLVFVFLKLRRKPRKKQTSQSLARAPLPYKKKKYLLSKAEHSFFKVLENVINSDEHYIFAQVRLADIVYIPKGTNKYMSYFNKISAKHVDFLLCTKQYLTPICAIELNDSSHQKHSRKERDQFVHDVLQNAGIPLVIFPVQQGYSLEELRNKLSPIIGEPEQAAVDEQDQAAATAPLPEGSEDMKIGQYVRTTMTDLFNRYNIPNELLTSLQDESYCKQNMDLNYPFLKKVDMSKDLREQRTVNGYFRYWAQVVELNGEFYVMCQEWYDRQYNSYNRWYANIMEYLEK